MTKQFQSGDCAPGEVIALLALGRDAAGLMPESEAEAWMGHVAGCESCAGLLRVALADSGRNLTDTEQRIADKIRQPQDSLSGGSRRRLWIPLVAALAAVGFGLAWKASQAKTEVPNLLARAYTSGRPFDWRLPDSGFAPVVRDRGSNQEFGKTAELLAAQAAISTSIAKLDHPSADLLRHRSWAQILDLDPDAAIVTLSKLVAEDPANTELVDLLGVAYAVRADATARTEDFAFAVDCFTKVLAAKPKSLRTRFNRALVLAKLQDHGHALDDLKVLISEETDPGWRQEAQKHADEAAKKIEEHRKKRSRLTTGPQGFLGDLASGQALSVDLYLERAFLEWIKESPNEHAAIQIAQWSNRTGDNWASSVLAQRPSRTELEVALAIFDDNRSGRFQKAREYALHEVQALRSRGQHALADYVETNAIYSATRLFDPKICKLSNAVKPPSTPFLRATTLIHQGNCDAILGEIHNAIAKFVMAGEIAAAATHRATEARALDAEISRRLTSGDAFTTIKDSIRLARAYWEYGLSPARMNGALFGLAEACSKRRIHGRRISFYDWFIRSRRTRSGSVASRRESRVRSTARSECRSIPAGASGDRRRAKTLLTAPG